MKKTRKIFFIYVCLISNLLFFATFSSASEQLIEANEKFTYNGAPIHPFLLKSFSNWASDYRPPMVTTVDVSASFDTNKFLQSEIRIREHWFYSENIQESEDFGRYNAFYYRWLGKMKNNIHVVQVGSDVGGTSFFEDLMLLKFSEGEVDWDGKMTKQLLLTIVGSYTLGDRYEGEIQVLENKVIVPESTNQRGGAAHKGFEINYE